jgi:hypothetical protein
MSGRHATLATGTVLLVAIMVMTASSAQAAEQPADMMVSIGGVTPDPPVAGEEFRLKLQLVNAPLDEDVPSPPGPALATYDIVLPSGLVVLPAGPDLAGWGPGADCVSRCPVDVYNGGSPTGVLIHYRLRAVAAGSYVVKVSITSSGRPDPELRNNEITYAITVVAPARSKITAGRVVSSPPSPQAGKPYALTLPLTKAGEPVTPASVRCTATLQSQALKGVAARAPGKARCAWKIPAGAAGKTIRARITATAGGKTFTASRVTRVR